MRAKILVVIALAIAPNLFAQWKGANQLIEQLATDRVEAFAEALESGDLSTVFRLLDPLHMRMNLAHYDDFDLDDASTVDFAIRNWGMMTGRGAPFLRSLGQIEEVSGFWLDMDGEMWTVYFEFLLDDGTEAEYRIFMDPVTLLMYGASG